MIASDSIQKSKVTWTIEGDENSKFFHGIINKKRSHLAVRRVFDEGSWITDPILVKKAFLVHFESRFQKSSLSGLKLNFEFPNRLSSVLAADWMREHRQILDGPFILNEVLQWCKKKHKKALFFKVVFAKAYDSVRWDFLIDVLEAFGFGSKWCKWIRGTFCFAKASILVNGSPSDEFQFHCGLKQGLQINISKSQIMRVGVPRNSVEAMAASIGCSFLESKFRYLGVMVGECMSHKAWDEVVVRLDGKASFISGWLKNSSIGRSKVFTLLKSVLGVGFVSQEGSTLVCIIQSYYLGIRLLVYCSASSILEFDSQRVQSALRGDKPFGLLYRVCFLETKIKFLLRRKCVLDLVLRFGLEGCSRGGGKATAESCRIFFVISVCVDFFLFLIVGSVIVCSIGKRRVFRVRMMFGSPIDVLTLPSIEVPGVALESVSCPLCIADEETNSHILFRCTLSKDILRRICRWWNLD
ncbi:RNA-directed DNA polymerase, eukaryota [Tanacetum coccineum]